MTADQRVLPIGYYFLFKVLQVVHFLGVCVQQNFAAILHNSSLSTVFVTIYFYA